MKRNDLKKRYYKETPNWWKDNDGNPTPEYMNWLEDQLIEQLSKPKEMDRSFTRVNIGIIRAYENKETRPIGFGELFIILERFQIMLEEDPNRYTLEEFIQQEDFRRKLFADGKI